MKKNERLLRIAGLLIIIRDELEVFNIYPDWCEVANEYLEMLTNKNQEINDQFNDLYMHLDNVICEVDNPAVLTNELIKILQKDLIRVNVQHPINQATQKINTNFDVSKVKLLDSKLRLG